MEKEKTEENITNDGTQVSIEDEEKVKERLRKLGYVD